MSIVNISLSAISCHDSAASKSSSSSLTLDNGKTLCAITVGSFSINQTQGIDIIAQQCNWQPSSQSAEDEGSNGIVNSVDSNGPANGFSTSATPRATYTPLIFATAHSKAFLLFSIVSWLNKNLRLIKEKKCKTIYSYFEL